VQVRGELLHVWVGRLIVFRDSRGMAGGLGENEWSQALLSL
jgi:hypothetical protein